MGDYTLYSPGAEATDAIQQLMIEREKSRREQLMMQHTMLQDQIAQQREARQEQADRLDRANRETEFTQRQQDRDEAAGIKKIDTRYIRGDYITDPEDIKTATTYTPGSVEKVDTASAVGPTEPGHLPVNATALRVLGNAAQKTAANLETAQNALLAEARTDEGKQQMQLDPIGTFARFQQLKMPVPASVLTASGEMPPEVMHEAPNDPLTNNKYNKATLLTPNSMWHAGINYALTNKFLNLGLGGSQQVKNARAAIYAQAAAMAADAGTSFPELQAAYGAYKGALAKEVPDYMLTASMANSAHDFLEYAIEKAKTVPRGSSPIVNRFLQYWQTGDHGLIGNADLSELEQYIYAAGRDYNKVVSGTVGSVQAPSDSSQARVDQLIRAAQNPETFAAVALAMQRDMDVIKQNKFKTIGATGDVIARFLGSVTGIQQHAPGSSLPTNAPPVPVGKDGKVDIDELIKQQKAGKK